MLSAVIPVCKMGSNKDCVMFQTGLGGAINPNIEMYVPLSNPVEARYVRFKDTTNVKFPAFRIELFGIIKGNIPYPVAYTITYIKFMYALDGLSC